MNISSDPNPYYKTGLILDQLIRKKKDHNNKLITDAKSYLIDIAPKLFWGKQIRKIHYQFKIGYFQEKSLLSRVAPKKCDFDR